MILLSKNSTPTTLMSYDDFEIGSTYVTDDDYVYLCCGTYTKKLVIIAIRDYRIRDYRIKDFSNHLSWLGHSFELKTIEKEKYDYRKIECELREV